MCYRLSPVFDAFVEASPAPGKHEPTISLSPLQQQTDNHRVRYFGAMVEILA